MARQKDDVIVTEGIATEALPNGMFRVKLESGHEVLGHISGKMRRARIRVLPGDVMQLDGRGAQFRVDDPDEETAARAARLEIHPTGPLPGRPGRALAPAGEAAAIESGGLAASAGWVF